MKLGPWPVVLAVLAWHAEAWDLDTITVTGTRVEKRLADTPVPTEIITADEIQASGASDLKSILMSYGVITDSGESHGDALSLQGLSGNRILILVDGRRVPGRIAQNVEGDSLPLSNVDRIEIVRGPQSALYGSDAMGGVINIITRRPSGAKFRVQADNTSLPAYDDPDVAGTGQYAAPLQTQQLQLGLDLPLGDWQTSLNLTGKRSDFYWNQPGEVSILPRIWRGGLSLEADYGDPSSGAWTLGLSATAIDQTDQIDFTQSVNRRDLQRYETYAKYRTESGTGESWEFQVYQHLYRRGGGSYVGGTKVWTYSDPTVESLTGLEAWHTRDLSPSNILTLGLQTTLDALHNPDVPGDGPFVWTDSEAFLVQDEQYQDGLYSVIAGLRVEHGAGFGLFAAPKLAAQYTLAPGLRVLGGAGLGYRVPSVEDRYYDIEWDPHPYVFGNPDLKPEYSVAFNAGTEWVPNEKLSARVNAFHQELADEIDFVKTGTAADGRDIYRNENRARTARTGLDAEAAVSPLPFWTVEAAYGWLLAWDREAEAALIEDPAHRVRGAVSYVNRTWGLSVRTDGQWDSNRRLVVWGAGFSQDWNNGFGVYTRADNLTSAIDKTRGPFSPVSVTLGLRYHN